MAYLLTCRPPLLHRSKGRTEPQNGQLEEAGGGGRMGSNRRRSLLSPPLVPRTAAPTPSMSSCDSVRSGEGCFPQFAPGVFYFKLLLRAEQPPLPLPPLWVACGQEGPSSGQPEPTHPDRGSHHRGRPPNGLIPPFSISHILLPFDNRQQTSAQTRIHADSQPPPEGRNHTFFYSRYTGHKLPRLFMAPDFFEEN